MDCVTETIEGDAEEQLDQDDLIIMIGELLAAAADVLDGQAIMRRREPTRVRRILSILFTFLALAASNAVSRLAVARNHYRTSIASLQLRHLRYPPQAWAAP